MSIEQMIGEILRQSVCEELQKAYNTLCRFNNDTLQPITSKENIHKYFSKQALLLKRNWETIQELCDRTNIDCSKLHDSIMVGNKE